MKMRTLLNHTMAIRILVAITFMLAFSACEQQVPVSSLSSGEIPSSVHILESSIPQSLAKIFEGKALIDDDGGSIVLGDSENGYSYLIFPEDAINEDEYPDGVVVYFNWQSEGFFIADCYPEGIQFDNPVTIHLSYGGAKLLGVAENNLDLYYYNPLINQYESIGGVVNTTEKYVEGTITHFSRYAIGYE
jgi:hypothetical protein